MSSRVVRDNYLFLDRKSKNSSSATFDLTNQLAYLTQGIRQIIDCQTVRYFYSCLWVLILLYLYHYSYIGSYSLLSLLTLATQNDGRLSVRLIVRTIDCV